GVIGRFLQRRQGLYAVFHDVEMLDADGGKKLADKKLVEGMVFGNQKAYVAVFWNAQRALGQDGSRQHVTGMRVGDSKRNADGEFASVALDAFGGDRAAHQNNKLFGDGQPQPGAAEAACGGRVGLNEFLEDRRQKVLGNPDAGVNNMHGQHDFSVALFLLRQHGDAAFFGVFERVVDDVGQYLDRKSTRLNSSHVKISYAVFCLK